MKQVVRMDFVGAILVAGAVTNIVLALQWGGNTKPWNDKAVIIVSLSFLTDAQMIFDSVLSVFRSFRCPRRSIHCLGDISWRAGYDPNGRFAFAVNVPFFFLALGLDTDGARRYGILAYCFLTRFAILVFSYVSTHSTAILKLTDDSCSTSLYFIKRSDTTALPSRGSISCRSCLPRY
jgi:hypothetical protein